MSIVTIDEMRTYLRAEQVDDEDWLQECLDSAHRTLFNLCGRSFEEAGVSATARLYVPSGTSVLRIHDCISITAVTISGVAVTSYQKEPIGPTWSGETRPYEQIRLLNSYWWCDGTREATVSVTARWDWASTPHGAKNAVKVVCKDLAMDRDLKAGYASFADAGVAAARRSPSTMSFVADYGRLEATAGIAG